MGPEKISERTRTRAAWIVVALTGSRISYLFSPRGCAQPVHSRTETHHDRIVNLTSGPCAKNPPRGLQPRRIELTLECQQRKCVNRRKQARSSASGLHQPYGAAGDDWPLARRSIRIWYNFRDASGSGKPAFANRHDRGGIISRDRASRPDFCGRGLSDRDRCPWTERNLSRHQMKLRETEAPRSV